MEGAFHVEGRIFSDSGGPVSADRIQGPGRGPEKVDHGKIAIRMESQVTDDGGDPKFIGTEHEPNDNGHKPAEGDLPGEAGFKMA